MAFQKVMISGINTADLTVLKEEEKMALLQEIRDTGSKAAKDKLIQGNLRLVLSVIQRFTGRGEDIDDLFQIGVVGLIKAINNFDLSKEVRFSTYCVPMFCGELRLYLRDEIKEIRGLVEKLCAVLVKLAEQPTETVLPGYTHLQRAQPVTFAHHLLAYVQMLLRDLGRLDATAKRMNECPLGSGALAGTTYHIDRISPASPRRSFSGARGNSSSLNWTMHSQPVRRSCPRRRIRILPN